MELLITIGFRTEISHVPLHLGLE